MTQAKQVSDFVCKRRFKVICTGRGVGRKLERHIVSRIREGIDHYVSLADLSSGWIVENAGTGGIVSFSEDGNIFSGGGNGDQIYPVALVRWANRLDPGGHDFERDIRGFGPTIKCPTNCTQHIRFGRDTR